MIGCTSLASAYSSLTLSKIGSGMSTFDASSMIRSMFAIATTLLPKPTRTMEFEVPAGSICCVFASVIIVRIEFDTWRTSVLGSVTTVVISVAGWSLYVSSSSGST